MNGEAKLLFGGQEEDPFVEAALTSTAGVAYLEKWLDKGLPRLIGLGGTIPLGGRVRLPAGIETTWLGLGEDGSLLIVVPVFAPVETTWLLGRLVSATVWAVELDLAEVEALARRVYNDLELSLARLHRESFPDSDLDPSVLLQRRRLIVLVPPAQGPLVKSALALLSPDGTEVSCFGLTYYHGNSEQFLTVEPILPEKAEAEASTGLPGAAAGAAHSAAAGIAAPDRFNRVKVARAGSGDEGAKTAPDPEPEQRREPADESPRDLFEALIATVCHEVNNPVCGILGMAELLLQEDKESLPTEARERIKEIEQLASRLGDIMHGIAALRQTGPPTITESGGAKMLVLN